MARIPIPVSTETEVMYQHDRTCCVCNQPGKSVQIHHIDEDPSNNELGNLAVLCLEDHNSTQVRGGFSKQLKAPDVIKYRNEWVRRVRERREQADKIAIQEMTQKPVRPDKTSWEWEPPTPRLLAVYISGLPDVLKHAYQEGAKIWDAPGAENRGRVIGLRLVIEVIEQSWVQLGPWFSPYHFGGEPARDYFSRYLADRNVWNRSLVEAKEFGYKARVGTVETLERTLDDAQEAVAETVRALGSVFLEEFDYNNWLKRWNNSIVPS